MSTRKCSFVCPPTHPTGLKSVVWVLFILCFVLFLGAGAVEGTGSPYIVVETDNVWLLDCETEKKLFLLPKTYYAPLVGMDEKFYTVEFNGVRGKVPRQEVTTTGYNADWKGTSCTLRVDSKYLSFSALRMRETPDTPESDTSFLIPVTESFTYLGSYPVGEKIWYYVSFGEKKGYILSDFCDKRVEIIPFEPEKREVEIQEEEVQKPEEETSEWIKLIVIGGVGIVVIVLLIVILIPKKGKHRNRYYYEN